jgi:hypothetical protein
MKNIQRNILLSDSSPQTLAVIVLSSLKWQIPFRIVCQSVYSMLSLERKEPPGRKPGGGGYQLTPSPLHTIGEFDTCRSTIRQFPSPNKGIHCQIKLNGPVYSTATRNQKNMVISRKYIYFLPKSNLAETSRETRQCTQYSTSPWLALQKVPVCPRLAFARELLCAYP